MNNELTTVAEEALDELRGRFLTFYIDDTFYSIELCHIIEIISIQPTTYVPGLPDYFKGIINLIPTIIEAVINGAIAIINGIIWGINALTGLIGIPEIPSIPEVSLPRFKVGLDYVPEDDFPALLHKGEMVLTAEEAEAYRRLGGLGGMENRIQITAGDGAAAAAPYTVVVQPNDIYLDGEKISQNTTRRQFQGAAVRRYRG